MTKVAVLMALLALALAGCARSEGPRWAAALELPRGGAPLDEAAARVLASPGTLLAGEPVVQEHSHPIAPDNRA